MAAHRAVSAAIAVLATLAAPTASSAQLVQRTHGPDGVSPRAPTATAAAASSSAVRWCANTDPAANQFANGDYRYHAVYAHAADRPSRLASVGAQLQRDAFGASALLERQYGRAIRFDVGTPCGLGQLDISEVRLPFTEAQLAGFAAETRTATFDAIAATLRERGFPVASNDARLDQLMAIKENFLVWLDGPAPTGSCGQGTALLDSTRSQSNLNNLGGKLAVIFRQDRGFCGADVVRHEIGHNLGALQPDAPNTDDGVHCTDAFEDTMCAWQAPKVAAGPFNGLYFDYGNDDYWDPPRGAPLGWWTLNLSRFICFDAYCNRPQGDDREAASSGGTGSAERPERRAVKRDAGAKKRRVRHRRSRAARRAARRCRQQRPRCRAGRFGRA